MFTGKVVLITGGSRGIGKATALQFARKHANVIIVYKHNAEVAQSVINEITSMGGKAQAIQADIANPNEIEKVVKKALSFWNKIDILVNNAGIVFDRNFEDITYEESLEIVKTNMLAPLFFIQKIAPSMLQNGQGCIVNVSSTSGMHDFNPGTADYAMTKLALQSLTKDASMLYAPTIRVNAVAPGWVNTDMNADLPKDFVESETAKYHMKRWAEPQEIANAIVFLASPEASYITGHVLVLDGGHC